MNLDQLTVIETYLDNAKTFSDVFGKGVTAEGVRRQFARLAHNCHPDHVEPKFKEDADRVFLKLFNCYSEALKSLETETYDRGIKKFTLRSRSHDYIFEEEPYQSGEHSIIYRGMQGKNTVLAKIAATPPNNTFLEDEAKFLQRTPRPPSFKYVPQIIDAFYVDKGDKRYRANVMPFLDGYVSIRDITDVYPKGIDPRDASWIFRRVLGASLTARDLNLAHTRINIDHVLVHPITHNPLYLGWGYCAQYGHVYSRKETDVFDCATIFKTLVDPIPTELKPLIASCFVKEISRRPSVRVLLDDFTKIIRSMWGREYRPLEMPTRRR